MAIKPDIIVGHSVGELAAAYADGCLTKEETILTAYHRGNCVQETDLPPGAMAAVGKKVPRDPEIHEFKIVTML